MIFLFPPHGGSNVVGYTEQTRHYNEEEENVISYRKYVVYNINKIIIILCGFGHFGCMYGV